MRHHSLSLLLILLGVCGLDRLHAQSMPITIRAEVKNLGRDTKDGKTPEKTETKALAIQVRNGSAAAQENLTLKWTLFASRLQKGANDTVVQKEGSSSLSLAAGSQTSLETPGVAYTWTPQHSERIGSGRRARFKRIEESGHRYHGYRIQVFDSEGRLLGQTASTPALLKPAD